MKPFYLLGTVRTQTDQVTTEIKTKCFRKSRENVPSGIYNAARCPAKSLENLLLFGENGAAARRGTILQHPHEVKCLGNGHNGNTPSEGRVQGNSVHLQEYK